MHQGGTTQTDASTPRLEGFVQHALPRDASQLGEKYSIVESASRLRETHCAELCRVLLCV